MMLTQTKASYISPECEVLEMQTEGMIAASPGDYSGFGKEEGI